MSLSSLRCPSLEQILIVVLLVGMVGVSCTFDSVGVEEPVGAVRHFAPTVVFANVVERASRGSSFRVEVERAVVVFDDSDVGEVDNLSELVGVLRNPIEPGQIIEVRTASRNGIETGESYAMWLLQEGDDVVTRNVIATATGEHPRGFGFDSWSGRSAGDVMSCVAEAYDMLDPEERVEAVIAAQLDVLPIYFEQAAALENGRLARTEGSFAGTILGDCESGELQ